MRIVIKGLLMALAAGIAGCNSNDSKQVHNSDRPVPSRADADKARGNAEWAPIVNDRVVNQAADQAKGVINTATATADRVIDTASASADRAANGLNRTAARMQIDAQQTTDDTARLARDVTREGIDPNQSPARIQADVQRVTSDAAKVPNDAVREGNNLLNNATRDLNSLKNVLR